MTVVAHHQGPRTDRRPYIGVRALLTYARFVLEPNLDRSAGSRAEQDFFQQAAKVFLKAASAAGSLFG